MKKLKCMCKRVVSAVTAGATAMALVGAMGLVGDNKMYAATGNEILLNEGVSVVSTGREIFNFTAPEDGKYYFYSDTDGEDDVYATLQVGKKSFYVDDTENGEASDNDFVIEAELSAGEECVLTVGTYGEKYHTEIRVVDEVTANSTVLFTSNVDYQYVTVRRNTTLEAGFYSVSGTNYEELPEGYTIKWTKESDIESVDLECTETSYKISSVPAEDIYTATNNHVCYKATLYYEDNVCGNKYFILKDDSMPFYIFGEDLVVSVGKKITLKPSVLDYYDYEINLNKDIYTCMWYKYANGELTELDETGASYALTVTESDCGNNMDEEVYYVCDLYVDGEYFDSARFYLTNKDTYIECENYNQFEVVQGDSVTLKPVVYDYDGNQLAEDECVVEWYQCNTNTGERTKVGSDYSYNIESVEVEDCFSGVRGLYTKYCCEISYNGEATVTADFYLVEVDYEYSFGYDFTYASLGNELTLDIQAYDYNWNNVDFSSEEFTFQWYKINKEYYDVEDNEELREYIGTEASCTISSVSESDFEALIVCDVYKNNAYIGSYTEELMDASKYKVVVDRDYEVAFGDSLILEPKLVDYYGNEIEINVEDYIFEWSKIVGEETYNLTSDSISHTIKKVVKSDFCKESTNNNYYVCNFYSKDGQENYYAVFYIHEIEKEITTEVPETTTENETTTKESETTVESATKEPETTVTPTTKTPETTTVTPTTAAQEVKVPAKAKVKKVTAKKKASKTVKMTLKKVEGAVGYQVQVSKAKKFTKKNIIAKKFTKKLKVSVKANKIKNKKKLFVRARAYVLDANGKKVYGKWSKVSKIKIK